MDEPKSVMQEPNFIGIEKSVKIKKLQGGYFRFPNRQDFLKHLISNKYIDDENDLYNKPKIVADVQSHWHTLGQNGCIFARYLSTDVIKHGWVRHVVSGTEHDYIQQETVARIAETVTQCMKDNNIQAISLIFPSLKSVDTLVKVIKAFNELEGWLVLEDNERFQYKGYARLVGIMILIELKKKHIRSEVLGFGPFDFLPMTRQAPFTEIVIPLKEKVFPQRSKKLNDNEFRANLADMDVPVTDSTYDKMFELTSLHKKKILQRDKDNKVGAKAHITFTIPNYLWFDRQKKITNG